MNRTDIKRWLKEMADRSSVAYKAVLDWPYFNRTVTLVSVVCTVLGLWGLGRPAVERYFATKGNGNAVGDKCVSGNRNAVGTGNVTGDGNIVAGGDLYLSQIDYDRIGKMFSLQVGSVMAYVDDRIAKSKEVKVVNQKPILIKNPEGLDFIAEKARESLKRNDYSNAVQFARVAFGMIEAQLKIAKEREQFHVEGVFIGNMERVFPVLIEESLARRDFDSMLSYAEQYAALFEDFNPYAEALKTIAETRKDGRRLVFLSAENLRHLRTVSKDKMTTYLCILASYGYLQPVELDYAGKATRTVDYSKLLGLEHSLPYQGAFRIRVETGDGGEALSNEISGQWCGFGQIEFVDVHLEAGLAMGLPENDRVKLPIQLRGEVHAGSNPGMMPSRMVETKLTWQNKISHSNVTNAYAVIFRDWVGEEELGETYDTQCSTSQWTKVPEPNAGLLVLLGCVALALRRRGVSDGAPLLVRFD